MDDGTKWMYLNGHVGFGDWHHQIADQLASRAGVPEREAKAISNYALVNAIPAMEGHDIAWGHLHHNIPVFWNTNVDRNAVHGAVAQGIGAADRATRDNGGRAIGTDSLNSDDYNQNGGNVSVAHIVESMFGGPASGMELHHYGPWDDPRFERPDPEGASIPALNYEGSPSDWYGAGRHGYLVNATDPKTKQTAGSLHYIRMPERVKSDGTPMPEQLYVSEIHVKPQVDEQGQPVLDRRGQPVRNNQLAFEMARKMLEAHPGLPLGGTLAEHRLGPLIERYNNSLGYDTGDFPAGDTMRDMFPMKTKMPKMPATAGWHALSFAPVDPAVFEQAKAQAKRPENLSPKKPEDYQNVTPYLHPSGQAGYALDHTGDLQNVFNYGVRGAGSEAVQHAIANGARTLDAYDGFLPKYYAEHGFDETGRMPWNDEYAPEGWDYEHLGRPDVVFMNYTGDPSPHQPTNNYFEDWDEAKQHSRQGITRTGANGGTAYRYVMNAMGGTPVEDTTELPGNYGEAPAFQLPDGTTVTLRMQLQQGKMWIVFVSVNPQRQGVGTQVMNLLKQYSDKTGLPLHLIPADAAKPFYDKFDWLDNPHHYNYNYVPGGKMASVFANLAPWYLADGYVIVGNYGQTAEEIGWEEGMVRGTVDTLGALTCHAKRIGLDDLSNRYRIAGAIERRYEGMEVSWPREATESDPKATGWWTEG